MPSAKSTLGPIAPRVSAVDACFESLRTAILRGDFQPGTLLPPERTLAVTFGVNRVTVRGALARLATAGLLSVRQGSGYRVQDYWQAGGSELLPGLAAMAREAGSIHAIAADVLRVRRHMTVAVLERLLEARPGPRAFAAIGKAVDAFERAALQEAANLEGIVAADMAVVSAILSASGSPVLALCLNPIVGVLTALPELQAAIYAEPETNVAGYRALLAALEARADGLPSMAVELLAQHDSASLARLRPSRGKSAARRRS